MTHPRRGSRRISGGKILPYATTAIASGRRAARAGREGRRCPATTPAFRSGSRAPAASAATGEGRGAACRPTGRSGCVTTRGTFAPEASRASSDGTANSGVPKKTVASRGSSVMGRSSDAGAVAASDQGFLGRGFLLERLGRRRAERLGRRRMPQLPEPPGRRGPGPGEDRERQAVDDPEDCPDPGPGVRVAEEKDGEKENEREERDDDRPPLLVLCVPGRVEEAQTPAPADRSRTSARAPPAPPGRGSASGGSSRLSVDFLEVVLATRTSRGFEPRGGPSSPSRAIMSMSLPARENPTPMRRWRNEIEAIFSRTTRRAASS